MTRLETLHQKICDSGIILDDFSLPFSVSISHMDGAGDCYIALDRTQIANSAEEEVHLLHEMGHCETSSFYCRHTAHDHRWRLEGRANRWAIRNRLPISELRRAIRACRPRNDYELAEHLGLTKEFVRMAVSYYAGVGFNFEMMAE
ncbi:MAG: hypothetical protein FWE08_03560 [Oscillospiraceae bacterium]|nr:hypothetical protein [Oscillospiraceae bacterium]